MKTTITTPIINSPIDIRAFLNQDQNKDLLRFLTAGSVDDGKSTLIGRLLFDSKKLYDDQLSALERDSKREGHAGDDIDESDEQAGDDDRDAHHQLGGEGPAAGRVGRRSRRDGCHGFRARSAGDLGFAGAAHGFLSD